MDDKCEVPQLVPELPKYLTQWHLQAIRGSANAIVSIVNGHNDATESEVNLARECESLLTRIVKV